MSRMMRQLPTTFALGHAAPSLAVGQSVLNALSSFAFSASDVTTSSAHSPSFATVLQLAATLSPGLIPGTAAAAVAVAAVGALAAGVNLPSVIASSQSSFAVCAVYEIAAEVA